MICPSGVSLESLASQTPSWLKSQSGKERATLAIKSLKAAPDSGDASAEGASLPAAGNSSVRTLPMGVSLKGGLVNQSQAKAARVALGRTLTLWQGPPGTGKTTTLIRCMLGLMIGV